MLGIAIVSGCTAGVAGFGAASAVGHLPRDRRIGDAVVARVEDDRHTGEIPRRQGPRSCRSMIMALRPTSTAISPAPARIPARNGVQERDWARVAAVQSIRMPRMLVGGRGWVRLTAPGAECLFPVRRAVSGVRVSAAMPLAQHRCAFA